MQFRASRSDLYRSDITLSGLGESSPALLAIHPGISASKAPQLPRPLALHYLPKRRGAGEEGCRSYHISQPPPAMRSSEDGSSGDVGCNVDISAGSRDEVRAPGRRARRPEAAAGLPQARLRPHWLLHLQDQRTRLPQAPTRRPRLSRTAKRAGVSVLSAQPSIHLLHPRCRDSLTLSVGSDSLASIRRVGGAEEFCALRTSAVE
jgi:hypothetical protein